MAMHQAAAKGASHVLAYRPHNFDSCWELAPSRAAWVTSWLAITSPALVKSPDLHVALPNAQTRLRPELQSLRVAGSNDRAALRWLWVRAASSITSGRR